MGLPASRLHEFLQRSPTFAPHQGENLFGLRAFTHALSLPTLSWRGGLRFRGSLAGVLEAFFAEALFGALALVDVTWARRRATRAFLVGFGWLAVAVVETVLFSSVVTFYSP